ncbi:uncharacterized protein [Dysidea avara]|uniref:uncharacterized protein n=1 Tax=Dysidea avara TaxID=196820 RepID=UPI00332F660E
MIALLVTLAATVTAASIIPPKCEPLDKDIICKCRGHNQTYFPNDRFSSQRGAKQQFAEFDDLIRSNCSPHLVSFLCSRYFPPCDPKWPFDYIPPCKELCLEVKQDCEPILRAYGGWPDELKCNQFKSYNPRKPCVSVSNDTSFESTTSTECSIKEQCVDISHPKAKSLQANYKTYFPTTEFKSSSEADEKFDVVVKGKQWPTEVERLLLLTHYPSCNETNDTVQLLYPCKHVCRQVKRSFESQNNYKGMTWPDHVDCSRLPKSNCIDDVSVYFSAPLVTQPPVKTCKDVVVSSCSVLNKIPGLPSVEFPEDNATFAKYAKFLDSGCSQWLKPFLCYEAFSAHRIGNPGQLVKPCRNICRKAQTECSSCFKQHGITWDDLWNCKDFQVKGECIGLKDLGNYQDGLSAHQCPTVEDNSICS